MTALDELHDSFIKFSVCIDDRITIAKFYSDLASYLQRDRALAFDFIDYRSLLIIGVVIRDKMRPGIFVRYPVTLESIRDTDNEHLLRFLSSLSRKGDLRP